MAASLLLLEDNGRRRASSLHSCCVPSAPKPFHGLLSSYERGHMINVGAGQDPELCREVGPWY